MSAPVRWDEVDDSVPDDFTVATMPDRFGRVGDLHAGIDDAVFELAALLDWAERDEREGKDLPPVEECSHVPLGLPTEGGQGAAAVSDAKSTHAHHQEDP